MDKVAIADVSCILIGSALIGYATGSWAIGAGIALLVHAVRPWRTR